ncbi:LOW QUALITY PROTEIN: protein TONSOKU [Rutidosis leptorrhynchoides]|uniref:LOW QUALITY PROTEIN: protein TONSOKU n=1 Tax=Rutidosis leptorrhynchoides TaxID=125765 RepID=UPI003A992D77
MPIDDGRLIAAKRAYRSAKEEGNRQEEARWANVTGDILKSRGEYVEALRWFRIDYEISVEYLPQKHLLPTCQALGEVYLRLEHFKEALYFQKKHLELAKDADDLVEQQRASTQLGRTYHEMLLRDEDDHDAVRNAKKYFKSAMKLAQTLKENPPNHKCSFLKEYIDAHNNIGMLEHELDNFEEAKKILNRGLEICDEEEVAEDDDGRSRLHNNLGTVYMELRVWDKAREHIEKDIMICKRIGHCQGEAKGYINLGVLHYKVQKYEEAILCYDKALRLAKSMEDEHGLVEQIHENIETAKNAKEVLEELKKEDQNLKKLTRNMGSAKGTSLERKCLRQQNASLDILIEKSRLICAWRKHLEFAKRKKRIASELYDKEKQGDTYLTIGESYQQLRNFKKSIKWYTKSLEMFKSIGNVEGQALAKVNIGNALDSDGDSKGALDAFEEGYRISREANLLSVQLSALQNMHYCHMIRFDNMEIARTLQVQIDQLKARNREFEELKEGPVCCSETDTEGDDNLSAYKSRGSYQAEMSKSTSGRANSFDCVEDLNVDVPLIFLKQSGKNSQKTKTAVLEQCTASAKPTESSPQSLTKPTSSQQTVIGRKRVRVVLSDDEADSLDEVEHRNGELHKHPAECVATSNECGFRSLLDLHFNIYDELADASKCTDSSCSMSPKTADSNGKVSKPFRTEEPAILSDFAGSGSGCDIDHSVSKGPLDKHKAFSSNLCGSVDNNDKCITFQIDEYRVRVDPCLCMVGDKLSMEALKVDLACFYYVQLPEEKRSKGLLPIIQHMKCGGRDLESFEEFDTLKEHPGEVLVEVSVDGWIQKSLMKLYIDYCKELHEAPNMKLLRRLYNSEVEDEVTASNCELQDISVTPLLNALLMRKTVAMLDFSHNLLGNGTMEKLKQIFTSSGQSYGDLTLDLHCNRFGPTALFQICECPVLFARLEVLNLSGNHLTDSCGSYLSTILENCKALYSLNIERCSITSRTIQKVADSLYAGSVLAHLSIGHNNPVSGNTLNNLLAKLSCLRSFSELNLNGLKLTKTVVDSICQLAKTKCLSQLMAGGTGIGTDGALQITEPLLSGEQESVKLDLSCCGLTSMYIHKLYSSATPIHCLLELNLGGNTLMQEGSNAISTMLINQKSSIRVLILNKCRLGLPGILQIIQALTEKNSLEELNLADNAVLDMQHLNEPKLSTLTESSPTISKPDNNQPNLSDLNPEYDQLEVADSEDEAEKVETIVSSLDDIFTSSYQRNSKYQYIQELSNAIERANNLQFLDLSDNGFSTESTETLYTSWSLGIRVGLARRHVKDQIVHFSMEGNQCCRVKPCCRKA